jgi:hypothetical protein
VLEVRGAARRFSRVDHYARLAAAKRFLDLVLAGRPVAKAPDDSEESKQVTLEELIEGTPTNRGLSAPVAPPKISLPFLLRGPCDMVKKTPLPQGCAERLRLGDEITAAVAAIYRARQGYESARERKGGDASGLHAVEPPRVHHSAPERLGSTSKGITAKSRPL